MQLNLGILYDQFNENDGYRMISLAFRNDFNKGLQQQIPPTTIRCVTFLVARSDYPRGPGVGIVLMDNMTPLRDMLNELLIFGLTGMNYAIARIQSPV